MPVSARLKARLDRLYDTYGPSHLTLDPIQFPRRYAASSDREVAGFIAAALAYGRVAHIGRSVETVLAYLGASPGEAVRRLDAGRASRDLARFTHRFNGGADVAALLHILGRLLDEYGTLNDAFLAGFDAEAEHVGPALSAFCRRARSIAVPPLHRRRGAPNRAGAAFFFPDPEDGSACKRLNMFLRWMVRSDAVDLGVWHGVPSGKLVMPLDVHTARISRRLGLSARRTADWKMALEVTAALRRLNPEDPIRYDFAIFSWGLATS